MTSSAATARSGKILVPPQGVAPAQRGARAHHAHPHARSRDACCVPIAAILSSTITASGETSTFIPALAMSYAANPTEVEVEHAARAAGTSKYRSTI